MSNRGFGEFEVYKDGSGEWRWRLKAVNGKTIAEGGEGYSSKSTCLNGIKSVRKNAALAEINIEN